MSRSTPSKARTVTCQYVNAAQVLTYPTFYLCREAGFLPTIAYRNSASGVFPPTVPPRDLSEQSASALPILVQDTIVHQDLSAKEEQPMSTYQHENDDNLSYQAPQHTKIGREG